MKTKALTNFEKRILVCLDAAEKSGDKKAARELLLLAQTKGLIS